MTKGSNTWKGAQVYPQLVTLLSSPPSRVIYISSEGARNNLWSFQPDCLQINTTQCNSHFNVSLPPSNPLLPVFLPERDSWLCASLLPLDAGWTPSSNGNLWVWQTWPVKLCSLVHLANLAQRWELWHDVCTERHDSWQLLRVLQRNICPLIAFILRLVHASEVAQKSLKLILFLSFSLLPFLSLSLSPSLPSSLSLSPSPPLPPSSHSMNYLSSENHLNTSGPWYQPFQKNRNKKKADIWNLVFSGPAPRTLKTFNNKQIELHQGQKIHPPNKFCISWGSCLFLCLSLELTCFRPPLLFCSLCRREMRGPGTYYKEGI